MVSADGLHLSPGTSAETVISGFNTLTYICITDEIRIACFHMDNNL